MESEWNAIITFPNSTQTNIETSSSGALPIYIGNGSSSITGYWNGVNVNNSFSYIVSETADLLMYLLVYEDDDSATRLAVNGTSLSSIVFEEGPDLTKLLSFSATSSSEQVMKLIVRSSAYDEPSEVIFDGTGYSSPQQDWSWSSSTKLFTFNVPFAGSEVEVNTKFQAGSTPAAAGAPGGGGGGGGVSVSTCGPDEVYRGGRCRPISGIEIPDLAISTVPETPAFSFGIVAIGVVIIGVLAVGEREMNGNKGMGSLWRNTRTKKSKQIDWTKRVDKLFKD